MYSTCSKYGKVTTTKTLWWKKLPKVQKGPQLEMVVKESSPIPVPDDLSQLPIDLSFQHGLWLCAWRGEQKEDSRESQKWRPQTVVKICVGTPRFGRPRSSVDSGRWAERPVHSEGTPSIKAQEPSQARYVHILWDAVASIDPSTRFNIGSLLQLRGRGQGRITWMPPLYWHY